MYYYANENLNELWHRRHEEHMGEARRLARRLSGTGRRRGKAASALGFMAALVLVAGIMLVGLSSPAHASTTFTVTNTGDPGNGICDVACTLREAITAANATPNSGGPDSIRFGISGDGVKTIRPTSELPEIIEAVTIDGYTQPGASPNTLAQGTNARILIELDGSLAGGSDSGLKVRASNTVVRGLAINRFTDGGVQVLGTSTTGLHLEGNFIGTDPSGTIDLGNGGGGVDIENASGTFVGGSVPAARNLISGNQGDAVGVFNAPGSRVQGNLIGTEKDGTSPLGNSQAGVGLAGAGADDNLIGGDSPTEANTVAFNGQDGVEVESGGSSGNSVLSNSIFSNVGLGIDLLGPDESGITHVPTPNDPGDADAGPNDLLNKPVITSARTSGTKTIIKGKLQSASLQLFTLQFFKNSRGENEGRTLIFAEKIVATDADGEATFSLRLGRLKGAVTATATDVGGNTSEFSAPKKVVRR